MLRSSKNKFSKSNFFTKTSILPITLYITKNRNIHNHLKKSIAFIRTPHRNWNIAMNRYIKNQLYRAGQLNFSKKYVESLKIFDKFYKSNPEEFTIKNRVNYAWNIYHVHIAQSQDFEEIIEYAEFITEMAPQRNLNEIPACPYTLSVFKVLDILKKQSNSAEMLYWLDKLDPDLLDSEQFNGKSRPIRSKREKYYDYLAGAYLGCGEYRKCIETSRTALNTFDVFTYDGESLHNWRIGKSYLMLEQYEKAFLHLNRAIVNLRQWYIHRDLAEACFHLDNMECCRMHIREAILKPDAAKSLYYTIYLIFEDSNPELAERHLEMYENPSDELKNELRKYWKDN